MCLCSKHQRVPLCCENVYPGLQLLYQQPPTVILINIQRKQRRINLTTWTDCRLKKDSPPFINTALSWKYTLEPKVNRWLEKSMAAAQTSWSADLLQTQGESVWTHSQFVFYQPCVCVCVFAEQHSRQACAGLPLSPSYFEGWLFSGSDESEIPDVKNGCDSLSSLMSNWHLNFMAEYISCACVW